MFGHYMLYLALRKKLRKKRKMHKKSNPTDLKQGLTTSNGRPYLNSIVKQCASVGCWIFLLTFTMRIFAAEGNLFVIPSTCYDCLRQSVYPHRYINSLAMCLNCVSLCRNRQEQLMQYLMGRVCRLGSQQEATPMPSSSPAVSTQQTEPRNLAEFMVDYRKCKQDLAQERKLTKRLRNESEENGGKTLEEFLDENRSRFVHENEIRSDPEYRPRTTQEYGEKPILKSSAARRSDGRRPLCVTKFEPGTPHQARHVETEEMVTLTRIGEYKQPFHIGRCRESRPISGPSTAICETIKHRHTAIFTISKANYQPGKYGVCAPIIDHDVNGIPLPYINRYLCQGWIELDGACTLFV
ncbi:uncharacterized protein LOC143447496 isoform X2 [Clavelina lepadiformis]|uniref:Uncharacterized protein n=1 Tax=Clavelina lepadiformis TaxID=159417 RepID=A0ABP0GUR7_CLALP